MRRRARLVKSLQLEGGMIDEEQQQRTSSSIIVGNKKDR